MKSFCLPSGSHLKTEKETKYPKIKTDDRKNLSVVFQTSLSKKEKLEEKKAGRFEEKQSSKNARLTSGLGFPERTNLRKPTVGWEPLRRAASFEIIVPGSRENRRKTDGKCPFQVRECPRWLKNKSPTACETESSEDDGKWHPSRLQRKCRSTPNVSTATFQQCKKIFYSERDLYNVRRSLRLLGFELSDFGINTSGIESGKKWKRDRSTTLSTRVTGRSVSLESMRLTVKRAWTDDSLDESHRRLLARAAYEEWYFKKEKELLKKRVEEKIIRMKAKESFKEDFQRKKEKSEEEFKKWLVRKRMKAKENKENFLQNKDMKVGTKEESEKAFMRWKQNKERELKKKKRENQKEEEKRNESEKQKNQKKINAEKAFQKWKSKLDKEKKLAEMKMPNKTKKQEEEERKKRKEESIISFQIWKTAKDEQMKEKKKKIREAERLTREERQAQIEERQYEAEQAFEDWLQRVDLRKEQQYSSTHAGDRKIIPWIPP